MANTHSAHFVAASSQKLSATHSAALIPSSITLEAWIKPTSVTSRMDFILKDRAAGNASYLLATGITSGKLSLYVQGTAGSANIDSTSNIVPGVWTHVAVTYDGTTAKIYLNGNSTADNTSTLSFALDYTGTTNIFFGGNGQYVNGDIDEIRIWNTIRTGAEINANFRTELVGNESGLQGYWKLNNSLADSTANANTLTNTNSVTFTSDVPPFSGIWIDSKSSSGENGGGTSATWNHTCAGTDRILLVGATNDGGVTINGATYNGVAMTHIDTATDGAKLASLFYMINPPTGTHSVVVTRSSGVGTLDTTAVSYIGVRQTSQPEATNKSTVTANDPSLNITTLSDDAWLVAQTRVDQSAGSLAAGTNSYPRVGGALDGTNFGIWDSHGSVGTAGSKTMAWTASNVVDLKIVFISLAPSVIDVTMTADQGSYTLTGQDTILRTGVTLIMAVGTYIYSGFTTLFRVTGWINQSSSSSSFSNQARNTSNWDNQPKN